MYSFESLYAGQRWQDTILTREAPKNQKTNLNRVSFILSLATAKALRPTYRAE